MKQRLEFAELEQVYDQLAKAIDAAGPERESLFLARLAVLLAHEIPDLERVLALTGMALEAEDRIDELAEGCLQGRRSS